MTIAFEGGIEQKQKDEARMQGERRSLALQERKGHRLKGETALTRERRVTHHLCG